MGQGLTGSETEVGYNGGNGGRSMKSSRSYIQIYIRTDINTYRYTDIQIYIHTVHRTRFGQSECKRGEFARCVPTHRILRSTPLARLSNLDALWAGSIHGGDEMEEVVFVVG